MTRFSAFSDKELGAMELSLRINGLLLLVEEIRKERRYRAEKNTECTFKIPPHIAMPSEVDNMFDKDLFLSICEKYGIELSQTADNSVLKEEGGRMTDREKQINLQVIDIRASLHNIMKDIEPKELYNKLVGIDRQVYKIREIVKSEEGREEALKLFKQEPCEKTVNVQDCINAIENTDCELSPQVWKEITTNIMSLPPVTPARKKGKWIKIGDRGFGVTDIVICKCSECEYKTEFRGKFDGHGLVIDPKHAHKYCPSCGTEMENAE